MSHGSKVSVARQGFPASREYLQFVEKHAQELRKMAGIGASDKLDPYAHQRELGVDILSPEGLAEYCRMAEVDLARISVKDWSGAALPLESGVWLILLNPEQTSGRAVVTVMEEAAHKYFGHRATTLSSTCGLFARSYDPQAEIDAYWTAAASLLPSKVLSRALWEGRSIDSIALEFGTSIELVEFRVKTLRLWDFRNGPSASRRSK